MKRAAITIATLVAAAVILVSCGTYSAPTGTTGGSSGYKFRAFVSNPLRPAGTGTAPVLEIVDASQDVFVGFAVNLLGASPQPGLMVVSPNKKFTLVFSASNDAVTVVDNANESVSGSAITLPDFTGSMVVGADNATGYAAVRNAPVTGQSPGAVEVLNLGTRAISATIPVPNAHYIVGSHNGNRILALGDNQNTVTIIAPSLIGTSTDPRTVVCPDGMPQSNVTLCASNPPNPVFDHPVWAVFSSDDTTAYVLNCGPQCGGTSAGITVLDMNTNMAGTPLPVDAATIGLLSGSTLYVAGTPPGTACSSGTAAPTCGALDVVDLGSMTVTSSAEITDGYHNRMEMGANGQLFIGAARTCSNVNIPPSGSNPGEVRGCLSIFNSGNSKVVFGANNGDVTGLQAIPHRSVVYVVVDGELRIYDTTTDKLQSKQIDLIGQAFDVKVVDF